MVADIDIWRAAQQQINRYGQGAYAAACQRGDQLLEAGDREGFKVWQRICLAIPELERTAAADNEAKH